MRVDSVTFTAEVEVKYETYENWRGLSCYMRRNGWARRGGKSDGLHSSDIFTKVFTSITTMQKELADISDAFNH